MYELSLNVLDIVQNSVRAQAGLITVSVALEPEQDRMRIVIEDDGTGMSQEQETVALDPFYTTRTTRKIGLGLPYFEMAAKMCGGDFEMHSELGKGTRVAASFQISHIDRMPLGNMGQTMALLAGANPEIDFVYELRRGRERFRFDTREIRQLLDGVAINTPEIVVYMEGYINENSEKIIGGIQL
jgi:anti-sigma regulatory factor (Ser/Thr protein kinase)